MSRQPYHRLWRFLGSRDITRIILLLAMVLPLPVLFVGWESDDLVHKLTLQYPERARELGLPNTPTPAGLFHFLDGGQGMAWRMVERGALPWWTHPQVKSRFLRPITSLTHWLDYQLWPESPVLMHAHSLLWYVLLAAVTLRFFRSFSGGAAWGVLAAMLYAMDDTHATPIGWIANRSAILTTLFGVLAIDAHQRGFPATAHPDQPVNWPAACRTGAWLLIALLCGEGAAATCAFLFAFSLVMDRRPLGKRIATLLPVAAVVAGWLAYWKVNGFGAYAVGMYTDPFVQPARFLWELISRLPILFLSALAFPPADTVLILTPQSTTTFSAVAAAVVLLFVIWAWKWLVRDRSSRFLALAALISALPASTVTPSDRNLMLVTVGIMGLIARTIFLSTTEIAGATTPSRHRWVAAALLAFHLVFAGIAFPVRATMPLGPKRITRQFDIPVDLVPHDPSKTVVILNNASAFNVAHLPMRLALMNEPIPRLRILSPSLAGVHIERLDDHTLRVEPFGPLLYPPIDRVFRGEDFALQAGEVIKLEGMTVYVDEVDGFAPTSYRVQFAAALDDPALVWIKWEDGTFVPAAAPGPAERITLPPCIPK